MKAQDSPAQRAPGARTLDRAFRALGFPDKRRARFAPTGLPEISAEAMRLVHPRALTKRDANLLASVEHLAVALDSQTVDMTAFRDLAYLYLAVICCGWASDEDLSPGARNAALIGAIGFAGSANAAARVALGVEDQLIALLPASSLDASSPETTVAINDRTAASRDEAGSKAMSWSSTPRATRAAAFADPAKPMAPMSAAFRAPGERSSSLAHPQQITAR